MKACGVPSTLLGQKQAEKYRPLGTLNFHRKV